MARVCAVKSVTSRYIVTQELYDEAIPFLLVCPTFFHHCIHLFRACWWTVHTVSSINELCHLLSFHFLHEIRAEKEISIQFGVRNSSHSGRNFLMNVQLINEVNVACN